jgi:hypothetical protein
LECAGKLRKKELERSRGEFHNSFKRLEKKSYECAIAARLEFGKLTQDVHTLSSLKLLDRSSIFMTVPERFQVQNRRAARSKTSHQKLKLV